MASFQAGATRYVYDANGRLVVVVDDAGESARYVYDVMGNIVRVERIQAAELQLFAISPNHGTVDAPVIIHGQGYSSVASNNTVTFNGIPATVTSATANELKVRVPFGATTGPVAVTFGARSATSREAFTVDDTGLPPVIGSVVPDIATAGATLGVGGSHLFPVPGKTSLRLGGRSLYVGQGSDNTHLVSVLPPSASSGRVNVQTPYGEAESIQTVLVVPPGIDPASVQSRAVATLDNTAAHVDLAHGSTYGAVIFDSEGQPWASMQFSNFNGSSGNIGYTVYGPGNVVVQQGSVSTNYPSIHLPRLVGRGTYLVMFRTADGGSSSFDVSLVTNPTLGDKTTVLTSQVASQSLRAVFNAQIKDTLVLRLSGATTQPANAAVTYTVYTPSGAPYTSGVTSEAGLINLPDLPASGSWQVVAAPGIGVRGSMQVSVLRGTTGVLVPSPSPTHFEGRFVGQNIYLDFHANPFDDIELTLSSASLAETSQTYYDARVYGPAGNEVAYTSCRVVDPGGNCNLHLWYLPEGDYRVLLAPTYGGILRVDATLQKQLTGRVLGRNTTVGFDLGLGQAERLVFDATAGDAVTLFLSNVASTPQGQNLRVLVYRPDSGGITTGTRTYTEFNVNGSAVVNLPDLPVTGRYTVLLLPAYGLPFKGQLSVFSGTKTTLVANAPGVAVDTHVPGQLMYIEFDATQGQSFEFALTDAILTGAGSPNYSFDVSDSAGRNLGSRGCDGNAGGCQLHLWYLRAGHYRVTVNMAWGGTLHATASLRAVRTGRSLPIDTPVPVSLAKGEAEFVTFHANAGDTVALAVNSQKTTPAGQEVRYIVYRPDAGGIAASTTAYTELRTATARLMDLPQLPVSGDYTVAIASDTGAAIDSTLQIIHGETGTLPADGKSRHFETRGQGQSTYVDFMAHQGENLELTFANTVQVGDNTYVVDVMDAAGRVLAHVGCGSRNPGCEFHLWNLQAGSYRATVSVAQGSTLSFDVAARAHTVLPALSATTPLAISLGRGDVARTTFHASAGDTVALVVSEVTTQPAGQDVRVVLYRPDAGTINTGTPPYTELTTPVGKLIDLPNLPVSGDYTVLVIPNYGVPADLKIALPGGSTGNLPGDGASRTLATNAASQSTYIDFSIERGQSYELAFSNMVLTGASINAFRVDVYNEAGASILSDACSLATPGCEFHLWNLPKGNYRAILQLTNGGSLRLDAALRPHRAPWALSFDIPASLDLSTSEVQRLTFHANAGDTMGLQMTGVITQPVGGNIRLRIYRPDAGAIGSGTPALYNVSANGNLFVDMPGLPVTGDYTVLVIPDYGVPAHVRVDLVPGTTGHVDTDAPAKHFQVPVAGQSAYFTFHARPLDNLEVTLYNVTQAVAGSGGYRVQTFDPANRLISDTPCSYADPGCESHLWYLKEGDYRVVVTSSSAGAVQFDAVVRTHGTGKNLADDVPVSLNLGQGAAERVTFDAKAGDTRSLLIQEVRTSPAGQPVRLLLYSPDSGEINNATGRVIDTNVFGTQLLSMQDLPATGTYTLMVLPAYGVPTSLSLTERLVRPAGMPVTKPATITVDDMPKRFASDVVGRPVTLVFSAKANANLELSITHASQSDGQDGYYLSVYDPAGVNISNFSCYASWPACPSDMWNTKEGSYTVVVSPAGNASITFAAVVRSNTLGGKLARDVSRPVSATQGELVRFTFDAVRGETLALHLSDIATATRGYNVGMRVYRPNGGAIVPSQPYSSVTSKDLATVNLVDLPVSGTYTVLLNADYLMPFGANLRLVRGDSGRVLVTDVTSHMDAAVPGAMAWFDIDAGGGGNFDLALSNVTLNDGSSSFEVSIQDSAGNMLHVFNCDTSYPACMRDLWNLPPGVYRVAVRGLSPNARPSFDAVFMRNKEMGSLVPGAVNNISHAQGDVLRYTFEGRQGDVIGLGLSGITTMPAGRNTAIRIYRPDGGRIEPGNYLAMTWATDAFTLNVPELPVTGTYTVIVNSDYLVGGGGTLKLVGAASEAPLAEGTPLKVTAKSAGQNSYLNIDVSIPGNYDLTFSNVSMGDGRGVGYDVTVFTQGGRQIDTYSCGDWPACPRDFWNLDAGRYQVVVRPQNSTASMNFDVVWRRNEGRGVLKRNVAVDTSHRLGDVLRYTFDASRGDTVALRMVNQQTVPGGYGVGVRVYRPDGGLITPGNHIKNMLGRGDQTMNLEALPASGTYTVILNNDYQMAGTGQLVLADGIVGSRLVDDQVGHFDALTPGQNIYFDIDLGAGGDFDLTTYGVSSNDGYDLSYHVAVYAPGGALYDQYDCYSSWPACARDMWNAGPGMYRVSIQPSNQSARMTMDAVARRNKVKGELAFGVPVDIDHAVGDMLRYTFTAAQGDTVALRMSGIVNMPSGLNTTLRVFRPDGGRIVPGSDYSNVAGSDTATLNLPGLPVGGTYTVVVLSDYLAAGKGTLTLLPGVDHVDLSGDAVAHVRGKAAGQAVYMDVDAPTGGDYEFTLALTPQDPLDAAVSVAVFNAGGANIRNFSCSIRDNCAVDFWNLAPGRYRFAVSPASGKDLIAFDARFLANKLRGALQKDVATDASRGLGDVIRFTFDGRRKESVALRFSGMEVPLGGGTQIRVQRPDAGLMTPEEHLALTTVSGEGVLKVPNLPIDGTYTVIVSSDRLNPGKGVITLTSEASP